MCIVLIHQITCYHVEHDADNCKQWNHLYLIFISEKVIVSNFFIFLILFFVFVFFLFVY